MKKIISYRQYTNVFLMITLATGFREIPRVVAESDGNSGIITLFYSLLFTLALTGIIVYFLRAYPGQNLYDICIHVLGSGVAKVIALLYSAWAILNATIQSGFYSFHIQATIMPNWRNYVFILLMLLLAYYAQKKGAKTIFRLAEFILGPVLVLLLLIILSALPMIDLENLKTYQDTSAELVQHNLFQMCSLGGYFMIGIFFSDLFFLQEQEKKMGQLRLFGGVVLFTVITAIVSLICVGINGTALTNRFFYPFYTAVKSISLFQVMERLETVVVLISMLSDFILLSLFFLIALHCIQWVLDTKKRAGNYIAIAMIVFLLSFYFCRTNFEVERIYREWIIPMNLIMEYVLPVLIFFLALGKQKKA